MVKNKKEISSMKKHEKKITWSKVFLIITGLIFISTLHITFYMYLSNNISNQYDLATLGICVSVTGAIFGSNLKWYSKKSSSENHYKLRMSLYEDSAKVRLKYNIAMFEAMKKYNMTQADIDKVDTTGDADEMMNNALNSSVEGLNDLQNESESSDEIENFNI